MKVGRDYSWWVDYSWKCKILYNGEWMSDDDFDEGRFTCRKRDLKKTITEHIIKYELCDDTYKDLEVTIHECYPTTPEEI